MEETRFLFPDSEKPVRICLVSLAPYPETSAHLGFHWLWRLLNAHPDICCDRAFPGDHSGRETGIPLGGMHALIFSMPYELQFPDLLTFLRSINIPSKWEERTEKHPTIITGGHVVSLIPHFVARTADVAARGDAEILAPMILNAFRDGDRQAALDRLEGIPGFSVRTSGVSEEYRTMPYEYYVEPEKLPVAAYTTKDSVFGEAFLAELGRGCSHRCRFCYISHCQGAFKPYPARYIMQLPERFFGIRHLGLIGAAVADHPGLPDILQWGVEKEIKISLSSLKLSSLSEELLTLLHRCGETSLTIAPETGNERLRRKLGKPYSDSELLMRCAEAARAGFKNVKLYFLVGLPRETEKDVADIARLCLKIRKAMASAEKAGGEPIKLQVSVASFVPKPLTPWADHPMSERKALHERYMVVRKLFQEQPGMRLHLGSIRQALLQDSLLRPSESFSDSLFNPNLTGGPFG